MGDGASPPVVLVDGHVHIHECYDLDEFLDRAWRNLDAAARALDGTTDFAGVLLLTESSEANRFAALAGGAGPRRWRVERTEEACSLIAASGERTLALVAGHQVAAAEDLEVLMLGTTTKVEDGRPIRELLDEARRLGALRVLPWGPGKWFFSRGKLIGELLRAADRRDLFLGDEGGRPAFWPTPTRFREAADLGVRVLRGTDPLPFPWEVKRVGSFGFRVRGPLDGSRPWAGVRALVGDPRIALEPFGRLERPLAFVRNQYGMQLRKRRRPS